VRAARNSRWSFEISHDSGNVEDGAGDHMFSSFSTGVGYPFVLVIQIEQILINAISKTQALTFLSQRWCVEDSRLYRLKI
jgi:hypothetical protein